MRQLALVVKQRERYKSTAKKKSNTTADNLLNQNVNSLATNEVWVGDITYLRILEGLLYLAFVMDFY